MNLLEIPVIKPKHLKNNLDEKFQKLSLSSQKLAKSISSMGFPLELVIRVADKMGSDDKKVKYYKNFWVERTHIYNKLNSFCWF